jgi:hypothetical protein
MVPSESVVPAEEKSTRSGNTPRIVVALATAVGATLTEMAITTDAVLVAPSSSVRVRTAVLSPVEV